MLRSSTSISPLQHLSISSRHFGNALLYKWPWNINQTYLASGLPCFRFVKLRSGQRENVESGHERSEVPRNTRTLRAPDTVLVSQLDTGRVERQGQGQQDMGKTDARQGQGQQHTQCTGSMYTDNSQILPNHVNYQVLWMEKRISCSILDIYFKFYLKIIIKCANVSYKP